jgi:hypothetical protein
MPRDNRSVTSILRLYRGLDPSLHRAIQIFGLRARRLGEFSEFLVATTPSHAASAGSAASDLHKFASYSIYFKIMQSAADVRHVVRCQPTPVYGTSYTSDVTSSSKRDLILRTATVFSCSGTSQPTSFTTQPNNMIVTTDFHPNELP